MKSKKCTKCGREKPLSRFGSNKKSKDGLQWNCKECINKEGRSRRPKKNEALPVGFKRCTSCKEVKRIDMYYGVKSKQSKCKLCISEIKNKVKEVHPDGFSKCSLCCNVVPVDRFGKDNRNKSGLKSQCNECRNKSSSKWKKKNKAEVSEYNKNWKRENKENGLYRKLLQRVLRQSKAKKINSTINSLGYTSLLFKMRIEYQFKGGMSWGNHGEWEIDHKKPVSRFISQGCTSPSIINALSNLQPLWKSDNRAKGDKFNE